MTNVVPPLVSPTINIGNITSNLTGSINNTSANVNISNLNVGQQITIQINPQNLTQTGNNFLFHLDLSLPDVNGKHQTITVPVEFTQQLKLPSQPLEMQIRITAQTPQKTDFRVISIDGKPVSTLVMPLAKQDISSSMTSAVVNNISQSTVNIQKHPLLPLKLLPLIEQSLTSSIQISQSQISEFIQLLPDFRIKTEITNFEIHSQNQQLPINITNNNVPQLPVDIANKLESMVKNLFQNIVANSPNRNMQIPFTDVLSAPVSQSYEGVPSSPIYSSIEQLLQQLIGRELPAQVIEKGELKVLQTPFGEIVPEIPLKMEVGEQLLLRISELIIPKEDNKTAKISTPITNKIIEIIKPLQEQITPEVYSALVEKIPADNTKMLSNIISFLKAAADENINTWLGNEITDNLRLSGSKVQESLNQLESLLIGRKEENSQWRIIEVPFYDTENLRQIRVAMRKYTKEDNSRSSKRTKHDVSRFVIDTTFTVLGAFQFDGFSIAKDKRFDLIIRTEKDIGKDFCSQIMHLFRSSLSAVDYAGNIQINIKEKFIKLCDNNTENTILQDGLYI